RACGSCVGRRRCWAGTRTSPSMTLRTPSASSRRSSRNSASTRRSTPREPFCIGSRTSRTSCRPPTTSPRPNNPADEVLADVFKRYPSRLRLANAFGFDDLISETVHLFGAFPEVADSYRRRFRHILVDEYQDTNPAQYALIKALAGDGAGGASG